MLNPYAMRRRTRLMGQRRNAPALMQRAVQPPPLTIGLPEDNMTKGYRGAIPERSEVDPGLNTPGLMPPDEMNYSVPGLGDLNQQKRKVI